MNRADIQLKAYAILRRGNEILVNEVREHDGRLIGYRVPGGNIEFGETSLTTVQREIQEEIGAKIINLRLLPIIERFFDYMGTSRHEIVFPYLAEFKDPAFYQAETIEAYEDNGKAFTLFWLNPESCPQGISVFPNEIVAMLGQP